MTESAAFYFIGFPLGFLLFFWFYKPERRKIVEPRMPGLDNDLLHKKKENI